ncbi:MAG TPA: hypothetical protein VMD59_15375 [Acidimicrobiales bacterium]|nr:hypothetical protein [Acidimicrobiales bacterium]
MSGSVGPGRSGGQWELRFTQRALDDLAAAGEAPGVLDDVEQRTPWSSIVHRFREQRTLDPDGTSPIQGLRRGDVYSLHARDPQRAATWYDAEHAVCWMLAFVSDHDCGEFTRRQQAAELMPSDEDYALLLAERDEVWRRARVEKDFVALAEQAVAQPLVVQRMQLAGALATETFLEVLAVGDGEGDLWVCFSLPPAEPVGLHGTWEYELMASLPWLVAGDEARFERRGDFPAEAVASGVVQYRQLRGGEAAYRLPWRSEVGGPAAPSATAPGGTAPPT